MTANLETIELRLADRTAWITLDRPPLNVLNIAMMESLGAALERAAPKSDIVIFQGAGVKAFCAGADVADHTPKRVGKMLSVFHAVFRRLAAAECLTIAAVHGYCLGVVPDYELPVAVDALLDELRALSPSVLLLTRRSLARLHSPDFLAQLEEVERLYLSELMQTQDAQEGIRAFLEKRKPLWKAK